jgi:hypothetical protein
MKLVSITAIFLPVLIAMTVLDTFFWEGCLNGQVCACSDGGTFDYWIRDWSTIGDGKFPAVVVERIHPFKDMSDPDQIKAGWSVRLLWLIWYSLLIGSLAVAALFSSLVWNKIG